MARRILVAGNWKMNKTPSEAKAAIEAMKATCASEETEVLLCVPAIDIPAALEAAAGSNIQIGAENVYYEASGAYTGEIAPNMLTDLGVKYVILGHSERREYFAETNETVNKKMHACFENGLILLSRESRASRWISSVSRSRSASSALVLIRPRQRSSLMNRSGRSAQAKPQPPIRQKKSARAFVN